MSRKEPIALSAIITVTNPDSQHTPLRKSKQFEIIRKIQRADNVILRQVNDGNVTTFLVYTHWDRQKLVSHLTWVLKTLPEEYLPTKDFSPEGHHLRILEGRIRNNPDKILNEHDDTENYDTFERRYNEKGEHRVVPVKFVNEVTSVLEMFTMMSNQKYVLVGIADSSRHQDKFMSYVKFHKTKSLKNNFIDEVEKAMSFCTEPLTDFQGFDYKITFLDLGDTFRLFIFAGLETNLTFLKQRIYRYLNFVSTSLLAFIADVYYPGIITMDRVNAERLIKLNHVNDRAGRSQVKLDYRFGEIEMQSLRGVYKRRYCDDTLLHSEIIDGKTYELVTVIQISEIVEEKTELPNFYLEKLDIILNAGTRSVKTQLIKTDVEKTINTISYVENEKRYSQQTKTITGYIVYYVHNNNFCEEEALTELFDKLTTLPFVSCNRKVSLGVSNDMVLKKLIRRDFKKHSPCILQNENDIGLYGLSQKEIQELAEEHRLKNWKEIIDFSMGLPRRKTPLQRTTRYVEINISPTEKQNTKLDDNETF